MHYTAIINTPTKKIVPLVAEVNKREWPHAFMSWIKNFFWPKYINIPQQLQRRWRMQWKEGRDHLQNLPRFLHGHTCRNKEQQWIQMMSLLPLDKYKKLTLQYLKSIVYTLHYITKERTGETGKLFSFTPQAYNYRELNLVESSM